MSDGVHRAEPLLLVAVGGFAGATCRFLVDGALPAGFLSSFTTYSTFAVETSSLAPPLAAANVAADYTFGLLAVLLGRVVARMLS